MTPTLAELISRPTEAGRAGVDAALDAPFRPGDWRNASVGLTLKRGRCRE